MRKLSLLLVFLNLGLSFALFRGATGQTDLAPAAPLGSGFTYQGRLDLDGVPAEGVYDLRFILYDATDGGSQVGSTVTRQDVAVADGLFSVVLDFGAGAFNGDARWLEIAVREGESEGDYSLLSPRQQLSAAPYALHASQAGSVEWTDVQNRPAGLDDGDDTGLTGVEWTDVQNRPAGLDDGDDDTTYTAGAGLALAGSQFSAQGSPFGNVLVVAKSGGDYSSIQAALDSIGDASAANPYLIYVAPGVYSEQVTLKPYVTLEGAGEGATIIRWTGGSEAPANSGASATLLGADNAAVRHLTVESDGTGEVYAIAIRNSFTSPTLIHVIARASGANSSFGVYNRSSSPVMSNLTAIASDGTTNIAVFNYASSAPPMSNMTAVASGGTNSYGVYNTSNSSPVMSNMTATASGSSNNNTGVRNASSSPVLSNVVAIGSSGGDNYGVYSDSSAPTIRHSVLQGSNASVYGTASVANSQLIGPTFGSLSCFNNYDQSFNLITC